MAIVGCEHHSGMGLCSWCSREVEKESARSSAAFSRSKKLLEAASVCEQEGFYETARALRARAS